MSKNISKIIHWCENNPRIDALFLVGSYARDEQRTDSDIDLVIITEDKERMLQCDWIYLFGDVVSYQIEEYGACTSVRVFYKDSVEIEYGIVDTSWISEPLDKGTYRVLSDGFKLLYGANGIDIHRICNMLEKQNNPDS